MESVLFSWSSGKDSGLALAEVLRGRRYKVAALLTVVVEDYDRISMHGIRRVLLEQQADALGLPIEKVFISKNTTNEEYETKLRQVLTLYKAERVTSVVFGDIFLEDLRRYREEKLAELEMKAIFPLWKRDSLELAHTLIESGFRSIVTCVDTQKLGKEFAGREIDADFLNALPDGVDPCGENGEYHSFLYDGPIFRKPIPFQLGETVLRENRFFFTDLIPAHRAAGDANGNTNSRSHC